MKKTLYFYLLKEMTAPFLLGMGIFTFVLLMGKFLKLADMIVAKGVPLLDVLRLVTYILPSFCLVTIPMSFLLAVLLAFGRLSADSEITAMKACGLNLFNLLPPVLAFAGAAYLATTFITVTALPWGNTSYKTFLYEAVESKANISIKEKVFNDDFPGIILYVDAYDQQQRIANGVLIHDERNSDESSTILAETGIIISDPEHRSIRLHLQNGSIHRRLGLKGYRLINFQAYDINIDLSQAGREISRNELDMTFRELRQNLKLHKDDSKTRNELLIEFHKRFALPFSCLVFALVGVPLGIQNQRSGRSVGFSAALIIILLYYVLFSAGRTLGEKGFVEPYIAMWAPNILFLVFGVYLFRMSNLDRQTFFNVALTNIQTRIRSIISRRREKP